jgi:L-asparaginase/Glu-tRNA(Gln) amidotransferase subunit D
MPDETTATGERPRITVFSTGGTAASVPGSDQDTAPTFDRRGPGRGCTYRNWRTWPS